MIAICLAVLVVVYACCVYFAWSKSYGKIAVVRKDEDMRSLYEDFQRNCNIEYNQFCDIWNFIANLVSVNPAKMRLSDSFAKELKWRFSGFDYSAAITNGLICDLNRIGLPDEIRRKALAQMEMLYTLSDVLKFVFWYRSF